MRKPDFVIGDISDPYLLRWYILPRNEKYNFYLHNIKRSDDDRALHDHPYSWNFSFILKGGYWEVLPKKGSDPCQKENHEMVWRGPGSFVFRNGAAPHRLFLEDSKEAWTVFITGPRVREWGFYCPKGWRHWSVFAGKKDGVGFITKGCED